MLVTHRSFLTLVNAEKEAQLESNKIFCLKAAKVEQRCIYIHIHIDAHLMIFHFVDVHKF